MQQANSRRYERADKTKVVQVEHLEQPIKPDAFNNPLMGDLLYDFLSDVYKCQYWTKQVDPKLNIEKEQLMDSYFEFITTNRDSLDSGHYLNIKSRPRITFKEPLTQEIVALNAPDLSKDQDLW